MHTVSPIQPIFLQNSRYTEVSGYIDDTVYGVVALGDLGIIVHIYFSDTNVLVLALRRVSEVSAKSVIMMDIAAK